MNPINDGNSAETETKLVLLAVLIRTFEVKEQRGNLSNAHSLQA